MVNLFRKVVVYVPLQNRNIWSDPFFSWIFTRARDHSHNGPQLKCHESYCFLALKKKNYFINILYSKIELESKQQKKCTWEWNLSIYGNNLVVVGASCQNPFTYFIQFELPLFISFQILNNYFYSCIWRHFSFQQMPFFYVTIKGQITPKIKIKIKQY